MSAINIDEGREVLAGLAVMDRNALAQRWEKVFGCPAPRHSQSIFLRSALAWHCQMQHYAKVTPGGAGRVARALRRGASVSATASIAPGTRLLREWQGKTHHVTVLADGFEYGGQTFRSLTAIARLITGTPWSGPLFFGLRS